MQIVSVEALLSINETIIVQLISFLIFLFIINRVMFRPMRSLMKDRSAHVSKIEQDISDAGEEYKQLLVQIKEREFAVKTEAFDIREKLEASGNEEAAVIIESAKKEILDAKERIGRELAGQMADAKTQIKGESETLAVTIMEKVLDRRLQS
jgi:F-type H+-transporting ATPase subunit b